MFLTCLSNKKSTAPIVYLIFQILGLAGLVYCCPSIINYFEYPEVVLFWLNVLITITFYFNAHLRDPGYIPYDAVFFTDQEQPELGNGLKIRKRMDSLAVMQAKAKKSAAGVNNLVINDTTETRDKISNTNKAIIKGGRDSPSGPTPNTTNNFFATVLGTDQCLEKKVDVDELPSMFGGKGEQYAEDPKGKEEEQGSKSSNKEEENKEEVELVACEPSLGEEEDSNQNNVLDFNARSKTDVEAIEEAGSPLKIRVSKSEGTRGLEQKTKKGRWEDEDEDGEQRQEQDEVDKVASLNLEVEKSKKEKEQIASDEMFSPGKNTSEVMKLLSKGKVAAIGSKDKRYFAFNDEESIIMTHGNGNGTPQAEIPLLNLRSSRGKLSDNLQEGDATKSTSGTLATKAMINKKTHHRTGSVKDQSREIIIISPKLDELPEIDDMEKQSDKNDSLLHVERRYCTLCNLEQPLRAKHCKECEKCVAQYDHHCPWLGTCIGEKNHFQFYLFIVFQLVEILWGDFKVFEYMITREYRHWGSENAGRVALAMFLTFFLIMVISLFTFHTYLAFINQTTWETLSWHKISYLREWHEDWGSPFSEGTLKNLHFFCCTRKEPLKRWSMPKYKRPLSKQ